jgi:predicted alternative tryptophan synthase beta-subunit
MKRSARAFKEMDVFQVVTEREGQLIRGVYSVDYVDVKRIAGLLNLKRLGSYYYVTKLGDIEENEYVQSYLWDAFVDGDIRLCN